MKQYFQKQSTMSYHLKPTVTIEYDLEEKITWCPSTKIVKIHLICQNHGFKAYDRSHTFHKSHTFMLFMCFSTINLSIAKSLHYIGLSTL